MKRVEHHAALPWRQMDEFMQEVRAADAAADEPHGPHVHGFRSTFRQWAAEATNYPREVAEAALAHVNKDKVEAAYQRGDFFEKRRRLVKDWAKFCDQPAVPADLVALRRA